MPCWIIIIIIIIRECVYTYYWIFVNSVALRVYVAGARNAVWHQITIRSKSEKKKINFPDKVRSDK